MRLSRPPFAIRGAVFPMSLLAIEQVGAYSFISPY